MGDAAAYAYVSMRDAIADAGLTDEHVRDEHTGLIAGSGGGSPQWQIEPGDLLRNRGVRKVGPYMVPRTMGSTVSAALSTAFGIRGISRSEEHTSDLQALMRRSDAGFCLKKQ